MKDVIYVNAEKQAEYTFNNAIMKQVIDGEDSVEVTYTFHFVMNDLFQIAARKERRGRKPLSDDLRIKVKWYYHNTGMSAAAVARRFHISPTTVTKILREEAIEKNERVQKGNYSQAPGTQC